MSRDAAVDGTSAGAAVLKKKKDPKAVSLNSTELFAHLQQYKRITVSSLLKQPAIGNIHPAVLQLGLRYADGSIRGANARCLAMLNTFCQVVGWLDHWLAGRGVVGMQLGPMGRLGRGNRAAKVTT